MFACTKAGVKPRHIETPTSRSGSPSLVVDGVSYHSPYDPIRESSRFFNSLNLEGADILFQFGWGLGYGSEALRTRCKPSARIPVFKPDDELLSLSRRCFRDDPVWRDSRFEFVFGPRCVGSLVITPSGMSGNRQYSLGGMATSRATPQTAARGIEENLSNPASGSRRKSIDALPEWPDVL